MPNRLKAGISHIQKMGKKPILKYICPTDVKTSQHIYSQIKSPYRNNRQFKSRLKICPLTANMWVKKRPSPHQNV